MPTQKQSRISQDHLQDILHGPVAIGGVGGSGTRVIASILQSLDFYLGNDFNKANDNLAFTLLFKLTELWPLEQHRPQIQQSIRIFLRALYLRQPLCEEDLDQVHKLARQPRVNAPVDWLQERADKLLAPSAQSPRLRRWGWKEPNTHIFLPALLENIPDLKYIHVMRHGLDMAFSANQGQLRFWGAALAEGIRGDGSAQDSFEYWCAVHRRIAGIGQTMGANFLLLNFDEFCRRPESGIAALLNFLDIEASPRTQLELQGMVRRPASIGRHRNREKIAMTAADESLLGELGFDAY